MMTHPNDDEKLVAFLKQHRPVPPPVMADFEERLMLQIERQPLRARYPSYQVFWAIPGAIVVGLLTWGGYRWLHPTPQIATNPEELETFLISNWNGAIEDPILTQTNSSDADWQILADPKIGAK